MSNKQEDLAAAGMISTLPPLPGEDPNLDVASIAFRHPVPETAPEPAPGDPTHGMMIDPETGRWIKATDPNNVHMLPDITGEEFTDVSNITDIWRNIST